MKGEDTNNAIAAAGRTKINVTQSFLPPIEDYLGKVRGIFERGALTNNGPLVRELEESLAERMRVPYCVYLGNGTLALQLAIKALDLKGEIITTPYSYVATTSSVLWQGCTPVFVDVDENDFCIDPLLIEQKITEKTSAILATHVYGVPCDVQQIAALANKHGLKVIYDGAHAFGTYHCDLPLLGSGDIATSSFHATKLFHTTEGGAIFTKDKELFEQVRLLRSFGHVGDTHYTLGINAKNSEFHAAMGLCNLPYMAEILEVRNRQWKYYAKSLMASSLQLLKEPEEGTYNHAYFPVVFRNEAELARVMKALAKENVFPRRYFYPSLNTLPYLTQAGKCPNSELLAKTVICLPLFHNLKESEQDLICETMIAVLD